MDPSVRDSTIQSYFQLGLTYADIVFMLGHKHHFNISERQLKRILRRMHLKRREYDNLEDIVEFICKQLMTSGRLHGYRMMYVKCHISGLRVRMEHVRLILQALDTEGVANRRSGRLQRRAYFAKGPNYIWHLDGYDKLKPFGLCISGCICGFSRYIIWLNVYKTNNNPKIIAGYFMDAAKREKGCPRIVRSDFGTENVLVRDLQLFMRRNATDNMAEKAFMDGASTSNQRIEYWWAFLRRQNSHFWIQMFRSMEERGDFDGSFLDKSLVQFCFTGVLQNELDMVVDMWKEHTIRPSRNRSVPTGKPSIMYLTPSLWGVEDQIYSVPRDEIEVCCQQVEFRSTMPCDEDVYNVCVEVMRRDAIFPAVSLEEAIGLYNHLRQEIKILL